ncbi:Solute carrier family 2, facilitated glucose transporter member 9 Glucose transporter type 9 [Channa argus]|uniref:Solute carrier family 2, facilitated glucose transporter member 9 Glucose transporter type 9 n=1 Tax=Channa argus TaxID=215402 RepID=A0A6G1R163_CHAAH|nr:Solute carrier family 2, facilitated glucose transporter member 9 Glucose transporter type 9 [Channa argus]
MLRRGGAGLSGETLTLMYSLTVSVFAIGGLLGSLIVGMLVTRFGRKGTVVNTTVLVFIAGSLMGFSRICGSPEMIIVGRFITGIHSDAHSSPFPLASSPVLALSRTSFSAEDLCFFTLPYLLIEKHNVHATITALKWYRAKCNIQAEIEEMQDEQRSLLSVETMSVWKLLRDDTVRWQVLSVVVINIGMQLSGIDAIWFYTNDIFENAGIPPPEIQYTTAGTGIIEIIAGLIGCFTIEKLGRRPLMIGGFTIMGICSIGITLALILQVQIAFMRYISVCCVVGIIAGFCIGPAGVPFLITAELFKQSHRPAAYIVGGSLNWLSNFTVGFVFPFLQSVPKLSNSFFLCCLSIFPIICNPSSTSTHQMSAGAYCYLVFASICLSVAVYVYFVIPETKNKTFMEISQMFSKKEAVLETQGLIHVDNMKLKKMNGYGGLEHASLEFDSSSSGP